MNTKCTAKTPSEVLTIATACDAKYFNSVLNLIGSLQSNAGLDYQLYVYDLGISRWQRWALADLPNVKLAFVPAFTKYWKQCWSWKAWIWENTPADNFLYLDAGVEVLRPLQPFVEIIDKYGYALISQSGKDHPHLLKDIAPTDLLEKYKLNEKFLSQPVIAAGIIGFNKSGAFYKKIVNKVYGGIKEGDNLGWSRSEMDRNTGIHFMDNPPLRDCRLFRHDQTVLSILVYKYQERLALQQLEKFAGYKTPQDHPEQVIWHHRRQSKLPYIPNLCYSKKSLFHHLLCQFALRRYR